MNTAKRPVSINGVEFDALIDETRSFEATAPSYAVENGFSVCDSIILSPEVLEMTLFVTNTPVTWHSIHGSNPSRVSEVVKKLEEIFFAKQPVKIVTSDAVYENMAIESMSISKTFETGYDREIPISFKKIEVTTVSTTTMPEDYGKGGSSGASAGTANTSSGQSGNGGNSGSGGNNGGSNGGNNGSILWNVANGAGLIP